MSVPGVISFVQWHLSDMAIIQQALETREYDLMKAHGLDRDTFIHH